MSRVRTCSNFAGQTEQAFGLCRSVLGGEFNGPVHGSFSGRFGIRWMVDCMNPA